MDKKIQQFVEKERRFINEIEGDIAWELVEYFTELNRESSSADERKAADYIVSRLQAAGVPVELYTPELYLSLPRRTEVQLGKDHIFKGKTPAFSLATGEEGLTAPLVYLPSGHARSHEDLFQSDLQPGEVDVEGAIVLTEGLPLPDKVVDIEAMGAAAAVFISPGERIHEAICTPIWGGPDLDNENKRPKIAVASVNNSDGERIKGCLEAQDQVTARVITELEEGIYECPLPIATIPGRGEEAEDFILLHGHLDSWHYGIGDNAVGNGALLEIAIALIKHLPRLKRTVRIAWWPGHSTGRYAGSTWYADKFGVEIAEHCVAQVNCDSPGCRQATTFNDMSWTPELADFTAGVIKAITGLDSEGNHPPRAGDWSFNNLGISGTLMLSSTMPDSLREEKGYYGVGGCGGNIEWHTEADTIEVADRDLLKRDIRVYAAVVKALASMDILPLKFLDTVTQMKEAVSDYALHTGEKFNLEQVNTELDRLETLLRKLKRHQDKFEPPIINQTLKKLSRRLVRLYLARNGQFRQDPALPVPPLPDLKAVAELAEVAENSPRELFVLNSLQRGRNRIVYGLRQARSVLEELWEKN